MKKITLLVFALSIPVFAMAYGYDYGHDKTAEQVVLGVSCIFGLLSLILFFKVWGMTNDIRAFRDKYIGESAPSKTVFGSKYFAIRALRGADNARECFLSVLEDELSDIYEKCTSVETAMELLQKVEYKYKAILDAEGIDLKEMLNIESLFCDKYLEYAVGDQVRVNNADKYNLRNIKPYCEQLVLQSGERGKIIVASIKSCKRVAK